MEKIELTLTQDIPGIGVTGQRVELALTPSDVHVAEEMSTYLAGYSVANMRADEVSKPILVDHDEDLFRTFDSDDAFKRVFVKASTQADIPEVDPKTSTTSYKVVDRFLGAFIPTQTESNATKAFKPRAAAARRIKRAIQLDREFDTWGLLATSSNWASSNVTALNATQKWNGGSDSDPIRDLQNIIELSAMGPVEFWINQQVANAFIRHDKVKDHFRMFNGDAQLAGAINSLNEANARNRSIDFTIPGIGVVHVTAAKAKDSSGVLGTNYILPSTNLIGVVVPPGVPEDGEEIATTYTFRRRGPSGVGFETREFFDPKRGPLGGIFVVASMADVAKMTGNIVGGLTTGVYV